MAGQCFKGSIVTAVLLTAMFFGLSFAPIVTKMDQLDTWFVVDILRISFFVASCTLLFLIHNWFGKEAKQNERGPSKFVDAIAMAGLYIFIVGVVVTVVTTVIVHITWFQCHGGGSRETKAKAYAVVYMVYSILKLVYVMCVCVFIHVYRAKAFPDSRWVRFTLAITFNTIFWLYIDSEITWSLAINKGDVLAPCDIETVSKMNELNRKFKVYFYPFVCEFCIIVSEALLNIFFHVKGKYM